LWPNGYASYRWIQILIAFTDDYLRFGYVYLIRCKFDSFEKFKEYKAEVECETSKALISDHGGEYLLSEFKDYLVHHGIVSQLTVLGTPQ
jgi:hypothetical protein